MSKLQGLKLVELGWKCRSLVSSLPRLPLQTLSIFNLPLKKILKKKKAVCDKLCKIRKNRLLKTCFRKHDASGHGDSGLNPSFYECEV